MYIRIADTLIYYPFELALRGNDVSAEAGHVMYEN